jgi:hypothetical protein
LPNKFWRGKLSLSSLFLKNSLSIRMQFSNPIFYEIKAIISSITQRALFSSIDLASISGSSTIWLLPFCNYEWQKTKKILVKNKKYKIIFLSKKKIEILKEFCPFVLFTIYFFPPLYFKSKGSLYMNFFRFAFEFSKLWI